MCTGFWPGDLFPFGLLSYHKRGHLIERQKIYGQEDEDEAVHSQAILASYGWLLPQACYQGINNFIASCCTHFFFTSLIC